MIAYFDKGQFVGWWHNSPNEKDLKGRVSKSMGKKVSDAKMYDFPVALRNDQAFQFVEGDAPNELKLQIFSITRETVIDSETQQEKVLTSTQITEEIVGTEI